MPRRYREYVKAAAGCFVMAWIAAAPAWAWAFDPCKDAAGYTPVAKRYTKGLLFKVEKCGQLASYVFGTAHLADKKVAEAAANAFEKIEIVDTVGFELAESDQELMNAFLKAATEPVAKGHRLSQLLGKEYFDKLVAEMRFFAILKGEVIFADKLDQVKPWVAFELLLTGDQDSGLVLDDKLRIKAEFAGKPVFGIEAVQEQIDIFAGLPETAQVKILKNVIDHCTDMLKDKASLVARYIAKDLNGITALENKQFMETEDKEITDMVWNRLLTQRNKNMAARLLPRMNQKSVLLAVGALHLMGEQGILHLLEKYGYFITPMP